MTIEEIYKLQPNKELQVHFDQLSKVICHDCGQSYEKRSEHICHGTTGVISELDRRVING